MSTPDAVRRSLAAGALLLLLGPLACSDPSADWQVGGVYSISNGDGTFGVVKLLALEPGAASVRIYPRTWPMRPVSVDLASLDLGALPTAGAGDSGAGIGIGHLPLAPRDFALWWPVLISVEEVTADELDGYRMWKELGGDVLSVPAE